MFSTKTILSVAVTAFVFGATIITADAHGPGNHSGPANQSGPTSNLGNKPIKTSSNMPQRQMKHGRKHSGDANDIDPQENDDVCKWTKKNGHDVKVCSDDE